MTAGCPNFSVLSACGVAALAEGEGEGEGEGVRAAESLASESSPDDSHPARAARAATLRGAVLITADECIGSTSANAWKC
ncbi:hypothetical protein GCM10009727_30200 [Actinomadura napierensis]|uniref:Secreted protein n=1 Tax=Actinomadura napierensis TaxID=267854 RepID=A0ABP5KQ15_9ACTN